MSTILAGTGDARLRLMHSTIGRGVLIALTCLTLFALPRPKVAHAGPAIKYPDPYVEMIFSDGRSLKIEMFVNSAPKTVAHFLGLVNKNFYDGILFHRVITNYCAQAGDPKSKTIDGSKLRDLTDRQVFEKYDLGGGGSGKTVKLEANLPNDIGTMALARSFDRDSGDSQFFFNLAVNHALNDHYSVFGKIISGKSADGKASDGIDVMKSIRQGDMIKSIREVTETPDIDKK